MEKPFIQHRVAIWDKIASQTETPESQPITITLPDGTEIQGESFFTTPNEIAKRIKVKCIIAKVNGVLWDLNRPFESDANLELIKFGTPEGNHVFWHSSAHVLGQALEQLYDNVSLADGPPLDDVGGFFYSCKMGEQTVSQNDYDQLNKLMEQMRNEDHPFVRIELTKDQAAEMFKDNKLKLDIISKIPEETPCTAYRCGSFIDLCRGPHVPTTGMVRAIQVTKNSAAVHKATDTALQRVYGISFPDKKLMKKHLRFLEEMKERDHRTIGRKLDLFMFHELSPGCAFFLEHGTRIYNTLVDFIKREYRKRGYTEVITPNMYNCDLWKTSGHYKNYKEDMFLVECDKKEFGLKPMNCPGHCLIFQSKLRSYRDLPLRIADFGVLHRNEIHGALSGLTRVRRFQQDDAHIFVREDQIGEEILKCLQMLKYVYDIFGFQFSMCLSTRPEKAMGEVEVWNRAEEMLKSSLTQFGKEWSINERHGAFYGPKIDIELTDAIGRKHQCATIQLDFQLPINHNLTYKTETGYERPVIIHRAILGSVERMIAVLLEHTAGKLPFWLSPRQCIVIPIDNKFSDYVMKVHKAIFNAGYYVDYDLGTNQFKKKIRESQLLLYNFTLVIGSREVENGTVNVRVRENQKEQKEVDLDEFVASLKELIP